MSNTSTLYTSTPPYHLLMLSNYSLCQLLYPLLSLCIYCLTLYLLSTSIHFVYLLDSRITLYIHITIHSNENNQHPIHCIYLSFWLTISLPLLFALLYTLINSFSTATLLSTVHISPTMLQHPPWNKTSVATTILAPSPSILLFLLLIP